MNDSSRTIAVLQKIAADPAILGRFLNTLSCLEYVGTRKIIKSRPSEEIDATVLQHIVEEAGHALLLKRLASEVCPVPIPTYESRHLLAGDEAVRYFQDLDHAIEAQLLESFPDDPTLRATLNYLYTTLLIEERADVFYPILKAVLAERTGSSTVSRILREEQGHKATVAVAIVRLDSQSATRTSALRATEHTLFARLLTALEHVIIR